MFKWRKKSILYTWLQSYALVLFIPVVMMGIAYMQTHRVIEEEINRANFSLLTQLREQIDSQIEHVHRMRDVIAFNTHVRKFLFAPRELNTDHRVAMVQAFADFRLYSSTNRYVNHFYIYFANGDFILTDRSYYSPEVYYQMYLEGSGIAYDEWRSFLDRQYRGVFMNGEELGMEPGSGSLMLAQSLPIENPASKLATLVIHMNKEHLETSLRNIQTYNEGNAYIMNDTNQIMASVERIAPASPLAWQPAGDYGTFQGKNGDGQLIVSYIRSSLVNWTYVYTLPSDVYQEKVEYVRNLSILMVVIAIILGAATAIYGARRNYNPIHRLMNMLSLKFRLRPSPSDNEMNYIEATLEQTLEQNVEMNRVIEQQNTFLRSNLIVRLLKGRLEANFPLEEALAEYRLDLEAGQCAVMLFYIEDFSGLFREEELDPEKNLRFVHLIMSNIIEELAGREHRGWMTEVDEMLACLVNFESGADSEEAKASLLRLLEEARSIIEQRFRIVFTAAISAVHPSIAAIPDAYRQAVEAMEYRMLMGTGATIDYERIQEQGAGYAYPLEMEQQLINQVKSGDYDKAKAIMDNVIESNLHGGGLSVGLARCFMFDMISTMMKASMEAASVHPELYEDNCRAVQAILQEQTIGEMRQRMDMFLHSVCTHVDSRKKSRNVRLKEDLLRYISSHYMNPNVSVATISEHFDLHPSYLSRFFKDQTGDSLSDYLNRYRISEAKRMLLADDAVIKNVGEAVGIYSVSTFIRLFKKYEGVTPGVYREMNKDSSL